MASLLAMGNGVYNRDGIVIDYNGRQGHHPKECNCVKHINNAGKVNPPQTMTQGVNPVVNPQNLTFDQWKAAQAEKAQYDAYMASNGGVDSAPSNVLPVNPNPVPPANPNPVVVNPVVQTPPVVINPVVPTFVAGQTEYIIPIAIDLSGKPDSMAKVTDARNHAEPKFTNGIHDFRFAKGYASRSIVGEGVWGLKLFRIS